MRTVKFVTTKGGQGATTSACAYGVHHAASGERVHLRAGSRDAFCPFGVNDLEFGDVLNPSPGFTVGWRMPDEPVDLLIFDGDLGPADRTVLVMRPCYITLLHASNNPIVQAEVTDVLLIQEPGRSLVGSDVSNVLDRPVVTAPWDPAVHRRVDSGLLAQRPVPASLSEAFAQIDTRLLSVGGGRP